MFYLLFFSHLQAQTASEARKSATSLLSPQLQAMQRDANANPASLWIAQGQELLAKACVGCHSQSVDLAKSVATFPKLSQGGSGSLTLMNLEDQLLRCQSRAGLEAKAESPNTLALSATLHQAAQGLKIAVQRPASPSAEASAWNAHYAAGSQLYERRMGRMNLACLHCHDERVGAQMRGDVVSQAHPTGFPIYRLAWQTLGSLERRLRACYSGVQASIPAPGSIELRQLELYLKVRAEGMPLEGASIRR